MPNSILILILVLIREGANRELPGPTLDLMHMCIAMSNSKGGVQGQPGTA